MPNLIEQTLEALSADQLKSIIVKLDNDLSNEAIATQILAERVLEARIGGTEFFNFLYANKTPKF